MDLRLAIPLVPLLLSGCDAAMDDDDVDDDTAPVCEETAEVTASGNSFSFSSEGGRIQGAKVTVLERPGLTDVTDEDGGWSFEGLPSGEGVTFVQRHRDHPAIATGTHLPCGEDLEQISFQSPDWEIYELMALFAGVEADPTVCQIATTVTIPGGTLYTTEAGTHGEAGATVTIDPPLPAEHGPIYFNLVTYNVIYPDPELTETTDDGGVLFVNVPPGDYLLEAHKADTAFTAARITCVPGLIVNASPPWGLNVLP